LEATGETPVIWVMQLGSVIGHATSTIKHPSLNGWRLVIVQPLNARREPEADCVVAVDRFNAGAGQTVIINSDGKGAREYVGDEKSPARWFVIGIEDEREIRNQIPETRTKSEG
jgi:ethanolamine utilization protein EutN